MNEDYSHIWPNAKSDFYYSPKIKYSTPYYISPIEIGLLWAKITYLKSHSKALVFDLQTNIK